MSSTKAIKLTWAQRMRTVLLTCNVMDASNVTAVVGCGGDANNNTITIRMSGPPEGGFGVVAGTTDAAVGDLVQYEEALTLHDDVDPSLVLVHVTGRNVYIRLSKRGKSTAKDGVFWPRLLSDAAEQKRRKNISVDWGLWKDEDDIAEEAEEEEFASIGAFKAFTMSNGVNVNGGGDPDVVARMLNGQ